MAESRWDAILGSLTESVKGRLQQVKKEDLVEYCLKNQEIRNVAEEYLRNCLEFKRSLSRNFATAELKKEEGNKKYFESKYEESLSLYTESIFNAEKNDVCLPLAYSNRSLVLQQLGRISECLQDIDMAISTGYPKNKITKLLARKEKCEAVLNSNSLTTSSIAEQKELFEARLPDVVGGENENFASASKYLSVCYNSKKERHVIATEDIKMGDVLFVEKPFAFVLFKRVCHCCCKIVTAPIPCWYCIDVSYCSPKCRDDFWKSVHSFECGYHCIFKSVGIAHLSLRIILSASSSFAELKSMLVKLEKLKFEDGVVTYKGNEYDRVFNLVTNIEKYEKSDLFQYIMTAVLLTLYMKNYTSYFSETSSYEDLKLLTETVLRHILQLICNGHAIVDTFLQDSKEIVINETEERIGTAIYTSASMMNHSCEPSIINNFSKNYLIVRASKPIKKGEEVFNCYGPNARRMKRSERQEILSKQYFFKCECQMCCQPFDIQEIFTALKCEKCKGPAVPKESNPIIVVCCGCYNTYQISNETLKKQTLISSLMEEGQSHLNENYNLVLKKFLNSWLIGREIYYKLHKDLSYAADEIARCLVLLGDYRRSIMFLKCSVLSVEKRFGLHSIELANEMKKIGDVITDYSTSCEENERREIAMLGIDYYQKALRIVFLLYGPHHPILNEMEEHKKFLETLKKI